MLPYLALLELGAQPGLLEAATGGADAAARVTQPAAVEAATAALDRALRGVAAVAVPALAAGAASPDAAELLAVLRALFAAVVALQNDVLSARKEAAEAARGRPPLNAALLLAAERRRHQGSADGCDDEALLTQCIQDVAALADAVQAQMRDACKAAVAGPAGTSPAQQAAFVAYCSATEGLLADSLRLQVQQMRSRYGDAGIADVPPSWLSTVRRV